MTWWKDLAIRSVLRFSEFLGLIKGLAFFDQVLLRDMQSMTWDRVLISSNRPAGGREAGRTKDDLSPSQRRRAETTRLSR